MAKEFLRPSFGNVFLFLIFGAHPVVDMVPQLVIEHPTNHEVPKQRYPQWSTFLDLDDLVDVQLNPGRVLLPGRMVQAGDAISLNLSPSSKKLS
jgi:hypothetical protein